MTYLRIVILLLTLCFVACPDAKSVPTFAGHALKLHSRRSFPCVIMPGGVENTPARKTNGPGPMGKIDFIAINVEWPVIGESHPLGLIEAFARGAWNAHIERYDVQPAPMYDEICYRLRKQPAALTHGMEDLLILVDHIIKILEGEDFL